MKSQNKCPHCGKRASFTTENDWRPFCSERCRLIDLGEWIEGKNRIPTDEFAESDVSNDDSKTH